MRRTRYAAVLLVGALTLTASTLATPAGTQLSGSGPASPAAPKQTASGPGAVASPTTPTAPASPVTPGAPATGGSPSGQATSGHPSRPRSVRGPAAIAALGDTLPAVARRAGLSPDELRGVLTSDDTARVDPAGRLYFADTELVANPTRSAQGASASSSATGSRQGQTTLTRAEAFSLHSRPGSKHVIYLDFDGVTVSPNSAWTTEGVRAAHYPGWHPDRGTDAAPTVDELAAMDEIWSRVAEDYAPFDVDVTTQDPGEEALTKTSHSDTTIGTRVVISGSAAPGVAICGGARGIPTCGGVAWTGVMNTSVSSYGCSPTYAPECNDIAWVFPTALGNAVGSIADAASHEAGHTFGLVHDSIEPGRTDTDTNYYVPGGGLPGDASPELKAWSEAHPWALPWSADDPWAPIMGASYYNAVSQWSAGSYPGAVNWGVDDDGDPVTIPAQDDVRVIADIAGLRPDEGAETVVGAGAVPSTGGDISTAGDVDVYALGSCLAGATISAVPAATGPDLDIDLSVLDSSGAVVATDDPATTQVRGSDGYPWETVTNVPTAVGLGASVTLDVDGGPYFVRIDGAGQGDWAAGGYDDYGSLGAYSISSSGCTAPTQYVPGMARDVAALTTGTGTEVTWTAPASDGGSPLTGYRVQVGSAPAVTVAPEGELSYTDATATSAPVTVSVTALNAIGDGAGVVATSTEPQVVLPPGKVTGLSASVSASSGRVVLRWNPPSTGSPVDSFVLTVADHGSLVYTDDGLPETVDGYTLDGVPVGTWTFSVVATNTAGQSVSSITARMPTYVAPRAPGRPGAALKSGKRGGKKTVVLTWSPGAPGTAATNAYLVTLYTLSRGRVVATRTITAAAAARRLELKLKVKKKVTYAAVVRARNAVGLSPVSARTKSVTPK